MLVVTYDPTTVCMYRTYLDQLHCHRIEVGVPDSQGGLDGEDYKGILFIKCESHHSGAIIIHKD